MVGSTSVQFSCTFRCTTSTYQPYLLPKSPIAPVKLNPPLTLLAVNTPLGPLTGPPWPKGTRLSSGGGVRGFSGLVRCSGFFFALRSGIGRASGCCSTAFGCDSVSPLDSLATRFCVCSVGAGRGTEARLTRVALMATGDAVLPQFAP